MNLCDWSALGLSTGGCLGSGADGVKADLVFFGLIRH